MRLHIFWKNLHILLFINIAAFKARSHQPGELLANVVRKMVSLPEFAKHLPVICQSLPRLLNGLGKWHGKLWQTTGEKFSHVRQTFTSTMGPGH